MDPESQSEAEFHGLESVRSLDDRRHMIAETHVYPVAERDSMVLEENPVLEGQRLVLG